MSHKRSAALVAVVMALWGSTAFAEKNHRDPFANIPVHGTAVDGTRFVGTLDIHGFITNAAGQTSAVGVLNGTLGSQQVSNVVVTLPVLANAPAGAAPSASAISCDILHLNLAPLDLNLLGLTVHLDQVVLDIAAVPGAGNLLGNLLCAITNLLNFGLLGDVLTTLLNRLLGLLSVL